MKALQMMEKDWHEGDGIHEDHGSNSTQLHLSTTFDASRLKRVYIYNDQSYMMHDT